MIGYTPVKLISDGTPAGTVVEVGGQVLRGVTSAAWELKSGGGSRCATVRLELRDVEVEIHSPSRRAET